MPYELYFSDQFTKLYEKLNALEQKRIKKALRLIHENPQYPSLHTKNLQGNKPLMESRASMDLRLVWKFRNDSQIVFYDVGHHDILKKY